MNNDRLLNILRWVVTPIVLALIAGYFQMRVNAAKEQTRATYETLAPSVLELQEKVAMLTGRAEELARRPLAIPCPERLAPKPHGLGSLGTGKVEVMVEAAPSNAPAPRKVPARFEDMIQQQAK